MNTFLPYPCFLASARCLDRQRLGKQRLEVLQLLRVLLEGGRGWARHPATVMWRGCEGSLAEYGLAICAEWRRRGYWDEVAPRLRRMALGLSTTQPLWLGSPKLHASHRSNLLRKDPEHYGRFGWEEPNDLPYVWPVAG